MRKARAANLLYHLTFLFSKERKSRYTNTFASICEKNHNKDKSETDHKNVCGAGIG